MLTNEQTQKIKEKLLNQLENFPEDKRQLIKEKITSMSNEEMEQFLKDNELSYPQDSEEEKQPCIFCAITSGKMKSYKIDENKDYIAILEINPLSKGHSLVVPRKHLGVKELKNDSLEFAQKVSEKINKKFNPKEIKISKNEILEHSLIELTPIYGDEKEKHRATEEELVAIQSELTTTEKQEEKAPEIPLAIPEAPKKLPKLPPRLNWI